MKKSKILLAISSVLLCLSSANGVTRNDLFPYGSPSGDDRLPPDTEDISSPEINLNTPVKFFSREYGSVYVSSAKTYERLLKKIDFRVSV